MQSLWYIFSAHVIVTLLFGSSYVTDEGTMPVDCCPVVLRNGETQKSDPSKNKYDTAADAPTVPVTYENVNIMP